MQSCAGLRHDDLHEPVSGSSRASLVNPITTNHHAETLQEPLDGESTPRSPLTEHGGGVHSGSQRMQRTCSCPGKLKDPAAIMLVKPEYSRRNHKNFLEIYDIGAVLGTGGYAVVRECTNIATGEKFAAKMMTVSEHPESGGREIAKQVRAPDTVLKLRSM